MERKRRRRGGSMATTIGLVVGIHAVMGGAVAFLGVTQTGREMIYKIRFAQPPPEAEKPAEAPPEAPKPPPKADEVKAQAPKVQMPAAAASAPSSSVALNGGGGGTNWSGGKFMDRMGDGPVGAFHACVVGRYRNCLHGWNGLENRAEIEIRVGAGGKVAGARMVRSSGSAEQDGVLMSALECAEREFRCTLPPDESGSASSGRVVNVKLTPTQGGIRATP